jgi:hypothetical protein
MKYKPIKSVLLNEVSPNFLLRKLCLQYAILTECKLAFYTLYMCSCNYNSRVTRGGISHMWLRSMTSQERYTPREKLFERKTRVLKRVGRALLYCKATTIGTFDTGSMSLPS